MNENTLKIERLINIATIALAFLMPLFFLPITTEFYEFNKQALLMISTIMLLLLWILKIVFAKRVDFIKSPLNISIALLTGAFILATIFSTDVTSSIFGKYGRWYPSLFGFIAFIILYYVISLNTNSKDTINNVLYALLLGSSIVSLVGLLSYFGLYILGQSYAQLPVFNLTGSITNAAVLAAIGVLISISKIIDSRLTPMKFVMLQAGILNLLLLALYGSFAGWGVLAVGLLALFVFTPVQKLKENVLYLIPLFGLFFAMVIVTTIPNTRDLIQNDQFAKEEILSPQNSWIVVSSALRDFPILGTGPSTFNLDYTRYKPLGINNTDQWLLRFDKPHSEFFNVIGSTGIVGTLVFIFFSYKVAAFGLGMRHSKTQMSKTLGILLLASASAFFFTYATVLNTFIFFLLLALATAYYALDPGVTHTAIVRVSLAMIAPFQNLTGTDPEKDSEKLQYILVLPVVVLVGFLGWNLYKSYNAEMHFRNSLVALNAGQLGEAYLHQQQAIELMPRRSEYRNAYAQTNLLVARNIAAKEEITDEDRANFQQVVSQAIREVRVTTEVLNPLSAANWDSRAVVYDSLTKISQNANEGALNAYTTAARLDPNNPNLRIRMGWIYYNAEDYLSAANLFRQAANLRPTYANAHFNLAQALFKLQQYDLARTEYEITKNLVDQNSEDYALVAEKIEELASVAGAQDTRPTVEELEGTEAGNDGTEQPQEPLTTPEEGTEVIPGIGEEVDVNAETETEPTAEDAIEQE